MREDELMTKPVRAKKKKVKIGEQEVIDAFALLLKYKAAKANLDRRIIENERWYKGRHWEMVEHDSRDIQPVSAWLFNSIANKHADAMDNYPQPNVLPREASDQQTAEILSEVLPTVLEYNEYEQTYSDIWWYKIKQGTGVTQVVWDTGANNGLGDIAIKKADLLTLFWEPGITDIQASSNLFHCELRDLSDLKEAYPKVDFETNGAQDIITQYIHDDSIDTSGKVLVVDWYYKKYVGGKAVLHFCKFANYDVLFASENDPEYSERGFYDHGLYPFDFDVLFPEEDTPAGFGYIDIMKSPQTYIDKLDQAILQNALVCARKRIIVRADSGINAEDLADITRDVITSDSSLGQEDFRELQYTALPAIYANVKQDKIDELKETSGNRDFSQGSTTSGVTAASAIAALQEAGSKLSRDMLRTSYRSYTRICYMCLELMRQFYDEDRTFRVTQGNGYKFVTFNKSMMAPEIQGEVFGIDMGERLPIFDIKVTPEKQSPYSRLSQNELALQFFQLGFFNPQMADQAMACVGMMDFDGKDDLLEKLQQNSMMFQQMQQMQAQMQQMAQIIDAQNGTSVGAQLGAPQAQPMPSGQMQMTKKSMAERAGAIASSQATPK